jgi:uncharacterized OB-fold protein
MARKRPPRAMDPYAEQFWEYTKGREFRLQRCAECAKYRWPPGPTCDRCLSEDFQWDILSGTGKVLSWTTFRRGYFEEYPPPHTIIALELQEGPYFVSYPVGLEAGDLREGMALEVRWEEAEDKFGEYYLPVFGLPG